MKPPILRLSAISRLGMTFDREFTLDKSGSIFDEDRYAKYVEMHNDAAKRQNAILRSLVASDALLLLLLQGSNIEIPAINISLDEFPAAVEFFLIVSSFGFLFFNLAFFNTQAYLCIIDTWNVVRAREMGIDPDFITYSDIFKELYVKLFRRKMNVWGGDFFEPSPGYVRWFGSLLGATLLAIFSLVALHLILTLASISHLPGDDGWSIYEVLIACFSVTTNAVGFFVSITMLKSFDFRIVQDDPDLVDK